MTLTLLTAPSVAVWTLAELGDHLRLPFGFSATGELGAGAGSDDDAALSRALETATAVVEKACAIALVQQSWVWRAPRWRGLASAPTTMELPRAPVISIDAVQLIDAEGTASDWASGQWRLDQSAARPRIRALSSAPPCPEGGFEITFTAGYGAAAEDAPDDLRQAVAILAGQYFDRRGDGDAATRSAPPPEVAALLAPYRHIRL